jgi:hypothetical protein
LRKVAQTVKVPKILSNFGSPDSRIYREKIAAKRRALRRQILFECTVRDVAPQRATATLEAGQCHDAHGTVGDEAAASSVGLDSCS